MASLQPRVPDVDTPQGFVMGRHWLCRPSQWHPNVLR